MKAGARPCCAAIIRLLAFCGAAPAADPPVPVLKVAGMGPQQRGVCVVTRVD